ncbi:hypothetical protein BpHYR1_028340 [Brachionus plicatilis]|uniref:Uncharacterized protein n=1 Tax=Brachionus plicatilis TaxID=10195 RepID=A0A3M7PG70_BRAPC|nr:hypothetical protein BpHYR1_028340 [Brachionus plicatilis]
MDLVYILNYFCTIIFTLCTIIFNLNLLKLDIIYFYYKCITRYLSEIKEMAKIIAIEFKLYNLNRKKNLPNIMLFKISHLALKLENFHSKMSKNLQYQNWNLLGNR